ncbi:MAG: SUMF1/EgtB/PvdO family nonheme iron enzyme, partial [Planctomycetales bacterium]|nr:SUMF1/EgtB/PvdO family nonheme iron enzyme [Planctomycetales bacterium]
MKTYEGLMRVVSLVILAMSPSVSTAEPLSEPTPTHARLLFSSQGKTGVAIPATASIEYLEVSAPNQITWQPGPVFSDGQRLILLSMEQRRDGPGRPFDEYYTQTPTHLWTYDIATKSLQEIANTPRPAIFTTPALLLADGRLFVQIVRERVGQILRIQMDGSQPFEFTQRGAGLPYGLSASPDGSHIAYHIASPQGYQVWTCDVNGANQRLLAGDPEHLYFGTQWSPDGEWVVYVDCKYRQDPGHDWADICISRADGSASYRLTDNQSMWFAATYGPADNHGGGSNLPAWTADGRILYPRRTPQARVPWQYQSERPDTDHFNRDYLPQRAQGGTQICLLDPHSRSSIELTAASEGRWDFRATPSPDGKWIAFCRAQTGGSPTLWIMAADGQNARALTDGSEHHGADHPRWMGAEVDDETLQLLRRFKDEFVSLPSPHESTRVAKYEVTQELWQATMANNPSRWKGRRNSVEMVSFDEAVAFCQRITSMLRACKLITSKQQVRLPSANEWEFATRAGTKTAYSFGDETARLGDYAWYQGNAAGNDPPVGAKSPNPWGIYDVHGYLWEWCSPTTPQT